MYPRLYRSNSDRYVAGICGGIAQTYNWDPTIVRIIALVLILGGGAGLLAYLILWIVIPLNPNA